MPPTRRALNAAAFAGVLLPSAAEAQRRSQDADTVFPAAGDRPLRAQVPQIRLGIMDGENESDRLARFDGFRGLLEETFRVPVRLLPMSDYAGVQQALSARQIEIVGLGPSAHAGAWLDTNGGVEPRLANEQSDGSIAYVSVMVVRADSGITDLEGTRGKSLAWADPESASG